MSFHNPYSRTKEIHRNVKVLPKKRDLYRSRKSRSSPLIWWLGWTYRGDCHPYLPSWPRMDHQVLRSDLFHQNKTWSHLPYFQLACTFICFLRRVDRSTSTDLAKTWSSRVKETTTIPQTQPPRKPVVVTSAMGEECQHLICYISWMIAELGKERKGSCNPAGNRNRRGWRKIE